MRLLAVLLTTVLGASFLAALPAQAAATGSISGVVKDQAGQPLAGAIVSAQRPGQIGEPTVRTDAAGKYTIPGLAPGAEYHVSASKSTDDPTTRLRDVYTHVYYPQKATVEQADLLTLADGESRAGIDFRLTKRGRIAFHVKGTGGRNAYFVSLAVKQSTDGGRTWQVRNEGQNTTPRSGWVQITPEPGTRYKFQFVPAGRAFTEDVLKVKYDPVVAEWWNDAPTEARATPLSTTAEGQYITHTVQLDRVPKVSRKAVKITGTTRVGRTLRARTSAWSPKPVKLSYTWYRNGKRIGGQTKKTYKLRNADKGKRITVRVTGKKSGFTSATNLSKKTAKVKKRR